MKRFTNLRVSGMKQALSLQAKRNVHWISKTSMISMTAFSMATYYYLQQEPLFAKTLNLYDQVREELVEIMTDYDWDDGSWGPVFVRLAWHSSGTYCAKDDSGGSFGATMRFHPECHHGANAGLEHARKKLEEVKQKFPEISYGDLYTLAGVVAIEEMNGPTIPWRPGRVDAQDGKTCPPDGRLPDAALGEDHVRSIFYRMGFNDQEIVALIGGHCLGRAHTDRSGYEGPWTFSPTTFSNLFFTVLYENEWVKKDWKGPEQFVDKKTGELLMLPTDLVVRDDPEFSKYGKKYAEDEKLFFDDFAKAFGKLLDLGLDSRLQDEKPWYQFW